jgi:hypothetical protein
MSLSSRKSGRLRGALRAHRAWGALALAAAPAVEAQQITWSPRVETTAEWDSNRLMSVSHGPTSEWFQGIFSGNLTRTTATSTLDLRPQLSVQYSTLKLVDTVEAFVTGRYVYLTQLSQYSLVAAFHRQDSFNSEYGIAAFDPLNPNAPATQGSGNIVRGITRDSYQIDPSMAHSFTERFNGELDASFVAVRYSTQVPQELVSFNAPNVQLNGVWAVSQRSKLAAGPYFSSYQPINGQQLGTLKSNSYGVDLSWRYETSRLTNSALSVKLGRDEQDQFNAPRIGTNTWGVEWKGTYELQTSRLQFVLGRFLTPSSIGGETGLYQVRAQYSKSFTQTLTGDIAVRLTREQGLGIENFGLRDRGYGEASLSKAVTREFFLTGGLRWLAQKLPGTSTNAQGVSVATRPTAQNYGVFLTIGWHPLGTR